ncbi:MAG: hypothetical protein ACPG4K_00395 [Haloferula sp.]
MKLRIFVSGSAALFAAWLGLTFVRDVPRENYPELGRAPVTAAVEVENEEAIAEEIVATEAVVSVD